MRPMRGRRRRWGAAVLISLLASMLAMPLAGMPVSAQSEASETRIVVSGSSITTVPADGAIVELVIYRGANRPMSASTTPIVRFAAAPRDDDPLTEDELAGIVGVLVRAGVNQDAIEVTPLPVWWGYDNTPVVAALVFATLDATTIEKLDRIVPAVTATAVADDLTLDQTLAAYTVADCAALESAAVSEAVAVAQGQASQLADALGVELGTLVEVTRTSMAGAYDYIYGVMNSCVQPPSIEAVKADRYTLGAYNAVTTASVSFAATVQLTYTTGAEA